MQQKNEGVGLENHDGEPHKTVNDSENIDAEEERKEEAKPEPEEEKPAVEPAKPEVYEKVKVM